LLARTYASSDSQANENRLPQVPAGIQDVLSVPPIMGDQDGNIPALKMGQVIRQLLNNAREGKLSFKEKRT
jgi:hypothetical protein